MGIISLRCRKFCCIGRLGRLLQAVGSANSPPLPYYFVFCYYYTTCGKAVQPASGPSRVLGKIFCVEQAGMSKLDIPVLSYNHTANR